jgi:hypothetical protein
VQYGAATRTLSESGAIVLSPMLSFTDPPLSPCPSERIVGTEEIVVRQTIHVACPGAGSETWVDARSGLVLASTMSSDDPGGDTSIGYASIEFDPDFDDAVFVVV